MTITISQDIESYTLETVPEDAVFLFNKGFYSPPGTIWGIYQNKLFLLILDNKELEKGGKLCVQI